MKIKIKVDLDRLTLGDLIALEENKGIKTMRDIISRFMTDDAGEYLEFDAAQKILNETSVNGIKTISEQFADAIKGVQSNALPPDGSGR
jgi:hypothetical protein